MAPNIGHRQMPPIDVRHATAQTSVGHSVNRQHAAHGPGHRRGMGRGPGIVNQTLTHVADYLEARSATVIPALGPERILKSGGTCGACD